MYYRTALHHVSPHRVRLPLYKFPQFNLSLWWPYTCPLHKFHLRCMLWGAERHEMWDVRQTFTADTSTEALGQHSLACNGYWASPQGGKMGGAWRWQLHFHLAPRSKFSRAISIYLSPPLHLRDQYKSSPTFLLIFNIYFLLFRLSVSVWSLLWCYLNRWSRTGGLPPTRSSR
jgi:hypothetical protein